MTLRAERLRPSTPARSLRSDDFLPLEVQALARGIVPAAAAHFGLTVDDILGRRRPNTIVAARAFVVWALRTLDRPLSYPVIGELLGGRDHTSTLNLHDRAAWLHRRDPHFRAGCERIAAVYLQEKVRWLALRAAETAASSERLIGAFNSTEETSDGDTRH